MIRTALLAGLAAIAVGLFAVRAAVPAVLGLQVVTIRTPSMAPELPPGTLAYIEAVDQPELGMDVTFSAPSGDLITHRITGDWSGIGNGPWQTTGIANNGPDAELIPTDAILGQVVWSIPLLGWATGMLALGPVTLFLALIALAILAWPALIGGTHDRTEPQGAHAPTD